MAGKTYAAMALDKHRAEQAFEFWQAVGWVCTITTEGGRRELYSDGSSVFWPNEMPLGTIGKPQSDDAEVTRESLELIGLYQAVHGAMIL